MLLRHCLCYPPFCILDIGSCHFLYCYKQSCQIYTFNNQSATIIFKYKFTTFLTWPKTKNEVPGAHLLCYFLQQSKWGYRISQLPKSRKHRATYHKHKCQLFGVFVKNENPFSRRKNLN